MFFVTREIWVQVTSVQNNCAKLVSLMETITTSLKATLSFLETNKKLDATVYESIESTQVQQLLLQVKGIALSLEEAGKVTETIHLSSLSEYHKNALRQAISCSASSAPAGKGPRASQKLLSGFKNYLTKQDRALLSDEGQHPFARMTIIVKRMIAIGLYMPCEKTMGHITQTCAECFDMAGTPQEKHALLEELKRQLKTQREGLQPKIIEFPGDPRSCSGLGKAFEGQELMPVELAAHKPGKWLRASAKDLHPLRGQKHSPSGGSHDMAAMASNPLLGMLYNMLMQGQQQPSSDTRLNLKVYPKKVKALQDGAATADEPPKTEEPVKPEEPVKQPFQVGGAALPCEESGDSQVDEHLERMNKAFSERPKGEPKAKAKAGAKGAAKSKAKAKAKAKSKAKAKASAKAASKKRPCMIPQGGPTCYYRQGKIHRSDAGECWRVFRKSSDRCDLKVNWKGNPSVAWQRALAVIEEAENM